ncbi:GNAT family N-acetyltransferase [Cochlodiniinecator piscidefendens]|uniref:GNAT family N-acetyltransferase n=1 Tax=Cochlodiniinecator piscidefendens TaxID=2715756 RepID=UPI00140CF144|nr:GNAT family N-acetyltransferase [Cochlodiniinecator piscidefendens]
MLLQSERLILRPLRAQDAPDLQRIAGNDDVAPMLFSVTSPWPTDKVLNWIEQSKWRKELGFRLGICFATDDTKVIGTVGIGGNPVSCAYFVDPLLWNTGIASEAMHLLLSECFDRFDMKEVVADHFADNPASGCVLKRLGFEKMGDSTGESAARLEAAPIVLYRLTQQQFKAATDEIS